jgi:hypothetical protein
MVETGMGMHCQRTQQRPPRTNPMPVQLQAVLSVGCCSWRSYLRSCSIAVGSARMCHHQLRLVFSSSLSHPDVAFYLQLFYSSSNGVLGTRSRSQTQCGHHSCRMKAGAPVAWTCCLTTSLITVLHCRSKRLSRRLRTSCRSS